MGVDENRMNVYFENLKKFIQLETGKEIVEITDFHIGYFVDFTYYDSNENLREETYYYK